MSADKQTRPNSIGKDHILEIRDATVRFNMERGTSNVLDSVDLDVEREEVLGIVGESGSGKSMFASSLLDAIVPAGELTGEITYYPPSGNEVDVLGLSKSELRSYRWEEVSMVFQGAMNSFNPTMRLSKHFKETLEAHEYDVQAGMDRARDLISDLYMDPERILDSYPHQLSGGMQQRTLIALSLILEPKVLVLDEPTAALDLLMQRSIIQLIQELKEKYSLTIVFITHDLPLVTEMADRMAIMYAFNFIEVGPTDEILLKAAHPYTRALLNSTPNLDVPVDEMQTIEGSSPDPVDIPTGCSYHPRCPLADNSCRENDPELIQVSEDHSAACFYWEEAIEKIEFNLYETLAELKQQESQ